MPSDLISSSKYFLELGKRIFLSPSDKVVEDCKTCLKAMQVDLDVLTSIDVSSEPIHYLVDAIKLDYDLASKQISNKNLPVENEHLIKSLVENCVISNIKDPKEV